MKGSLVFGATGQMGSYLCEYLLNKGEHVYAVKRRTSTNTEKNLHKCLDHLNFHLLEGDITDFSSVWQLCEEAGKYLADFSIYNLAAQSHVHTSFNQPGYTTDVVYKGVLNILEWLRIQKRTDVRFCQFCSSEQYGSEQSKGNDEPYQNEDTKMIPNSPYSVAKLAAHNLCKIYRKAYNIFACCPIIFNTESPRRGENFVTQKIVRYVKTLEDYIFESYAQGVEKEDMPEYLKTYSKLKLGNMSAKRDWNWVMDTIDGVYRICNYAKPDDFVLASGNTYSVLEFVDAAFKFIGLNYQDFVHIDKGLYRPCEVEYLRGRSTKAQKKLGWKPTSNLETLIEKMFHEQA